MGYLITGYAFASEPDWQRLGGLFPTMASRGYRHKRLQLFMWDVWRRKPGESSVPHSPFTLGPVSPRDLGALPSSSVSDTFDRLCGELETGGYEIYPADWLGLQLLVASAAGVPTFTFTADDESTDFAAFIDSGVVEMAGCRFDSFELIIERDAFAVLPVRSDEDELDEDLLSSLRADKDVRVLETKEVSGERMIHDHPSRLWPKEWPNAEETLGLGTWDAFLEFPKDFALVFESAPSPAPKKAWWKAWS